MYSPSEQRQDPKVAATNYAMLPSAEPEVKTTKDNSGQIEVWAHKRGETKGGGEKVDVVFRTREQVVAVHGSGVIDGPVLSDKIADRVKAITQEIMYRELFLKSRRSLAQLSTTTLSS